MYSLLIAIIWASSVSAQAFQIDITKFGPPKDCDFASFPAATAYSAPPKDPEIETIGESEFRKWKGKDIRERFEKPTQYDVKNAAGRPQKMVPATKLNAEARRMIKLILQRAENPSYRKSNLDSIPKQDKPFDPFDGWTLYMLEMDEQRLSQDVEFGAWKVTLKSGKTLVALHTSRSPDGIYRDHALAALNGLLAGNSIAADQIARIDLFHNHPPGPNTAPKRLLLASKGDEQFSEDMRAYLDAHGGRHIAHSIYSIFKGKKDIIRTELNVESSVQD